MADLNNGMMSFAEALGEALGRGVARGINAGLGAGGFGQGPRVAAGPALRALAGGTAKRRGRPPKAATGDAKLCTEPGCGNPARSKGLCSKHYQAARREAQGK